MNLGYQLATIIILLNSFLLLNIYFYIIIKCKNENNYGNNYNKIVSLKV